MRKHERWQQKKRFILQMWAKGYKGMPRQGWVYMGEEWKRGMRKGNTNEMSNVRSRYA